MVLLCIVVSTWQFFSTQFSADRSYQQLLSELLWIVIGRMNLPLYQAEGGGTASGQFILLRGRGRRRRRRSCRRRRRRRRRCRIQL